MDLKKELLKEHSKKQAMYITSYIGDDPERFEQLFTLLLSPGYRISQRAAWVVSHCVNGHPHLLDPHLKKLVTNLKNEVHVAVKRNTLRILQDRSIPTDITGPLIDVCFNVLLDSKEPIAVKVFAMTVLANICGDIPELKNELKIILEDQIPYGSAGFRSRATKILNKMN